MAGFQSIQQDPRWKGLSEKGKSTVAERYFNQQVKKDSRWGKLDSDQQEQVEVNFWGKAGVLPYAGAMESTWNAFWRSLPTGDLTASDLYATAGFFDKSVEAQRRGEILRPAQGAGEFLGSALGSVAPTTAALGLAVAAPMVGIPALWATFGLYAAQNAGSARRMVYDYEKETGQEVSGETELALAVGFGATAFAAELGSSVLLRAALAKAPAHLIEGIGRSLLIRNIPAAIRGAAEVGAIEGAEEVAEQLMQNALVKGARAVEDGNFREVGILDGTMQSFAGGFVGGGISHGMLWRMQQNKKQRGSIVSGEEGDLLAGGLPAWARGPQEEQATTPLADRMAARWGAREAGSDQRYGTIPLRASGEALSVVGAQTSVANLSRGRRIDLLGNVAAARELKTAEVLTGETRVTVEEARRWQSLYNVLNGVEPHEEPARQALDLGNQNAIEDGTSIGIPDNTPVDIPLKTPRKGSVRLDAAFDAAALAAESAESRLAVGKDPSRAFSVYEKAQAEMLRTWNELNPDDVAGEGLLDWLNYKATGETSFVLAKKKIAASRESKKARPTAKKVEVAPPVVEPTPPANGLQKRRFRGIAAGRKNFTDEDLARLMVEMQKESRKPEEQARLDAEEALREPPARGGEIPSFLRISSRVEESESERMLQRAAEARPQRVGRTELPAGFKVRKIAPGAAISVETPVETPKAALKKLAKVEGVAEEDFSILDETPAADESVEGEGMVDEGNLIFQGRRVEGSKVPTLMERQRLVGPLQAAGVLNMVIQSSGQLWGPDGRPKNAILDRETGTVYLSEDVAWNTVGHEAFHRLVDLMGREHPKIAAGLDLFGGDAEKAGDAVGDYYAIRSRAGMVGRIGLWLKEMWAAAKSDFGLSLTQDEFVKAANIRLKGPWNGRGQEGYEFQERLYYSNKQEEKSSAVDERFEAQSKEREEKYIGNLNTERVVLTDAVKKVLTEQVEPNIERTKLSNQELMARAKRIIQERGRKGVMQIAARFSKTGRISLEESLAMRMLEVGDGTYLIQRFLDEPDDRVRRVLGEQLLEEAENRFRGASKLAADAGRRLQAYNIMVDPQTILSWAAKADLGKDLREKLKQMIDDGSIFEVDVFKRFAREVKKPEALDWLRAFVYVNWLSSPTTQLVNVGGNTLFLTMQMGQRALEAGVDAALSSKIVQAIRPSHAPRARQIFLDEVLAMWQGVETAKTKNNEAIKAQISWRLGGKRGVEPPALHEVFGGSSKLDIEMNSAYNPFEHVEGKLKGLATAFTLPTTGMRYADLYFKSLAYDAQMNALAVRESHKTGRSTSDILADPSDELIAQAVKFSTYATLMERDSVTNSLIRLRDKTKVGFFLFPFVNTLSNILQRGLEMAPGAGVLPLLYRVSQGKDSVQSLVAKQMMGASLALMLALAFDDEDDGEWRLTGAAPTHPAYKDAFYGQGKVPYAVKIKNSWVSYRKAEPLALPLAMVADFIRYVNDTPTNPNLEGVDKAIDMFSGVAAVLTETVIAGSVLENFAAFSEKQGWTQRFTNIPTGLIPYSSFWRSLARATEAWNTGDAKVRESLTLLNVLGQVIPSSSLQEYAKPRLNRWGEEIVLPGGVFRQWLPYKWSETKHDAVEIELRRLDLVGQPSGVGFPQNSFEYLGKRYLMSDEFYRDYLLSYGKAGKEALGRLFASPGYARLTDVGKTKAMGRTLGKVRAPITSRAHRDWVSSGAAEVR